MVDKAEEILNNLNAEDVKNEYRLMLNQYKQELGKLDYEKILWLNIK